MVEHYFSFITELSIRSMLFIFSIVFEAIMGVALGLLRKGAFNFVL